MKKLMYFIVVAVFIFFSVNESCREKTSTYYLQPETISEFLKLENKKLKSSFTRLENVKVTYPKPNQMRPVKSMKKFCKKTFKRAKNNISLLSLICIILIAIQDYLYK